MKQTNNQNVQEVLLTPMTNIGASALGAVIITFLAPPFKCSPARSNVVNTPDDSMTYVAPTLPHGTSAGLRSLKN